ncbi:DUF6573 family protein [Sulfurisoma sediminicola]|uniref:Uncharacterized protein n=2 Tax=Sulfurisoma sediminicola TaxID=1381557 RepID=A0A497XCG2_9PROT|nr:DUF6573 family protein [Sulfurisoma sediminicola]RLJ64603.1 hypothetical protein DFR35_1244 [Sulfurisoma sediminicola]
MYGHPNFTQQHAEALKPETDPIFGEVIHSYTRAQAHCDGVLIDLSDTAREAGIAFPVAITKAAWADCVEWTDEDSKRQTYQDEAGRLWDVIWMLKLAARRGGSEIRYQLYRVPRGGRGVRPRLVTLKAICGPGDQGEAVITVMLPGED